MKIKINVKNNFRTSIIVFKQNYSNTYSIDRDYRDCDQVLTKLKIKMLIKNENILNP